MATATDKEAIFATLNALHAAQEAHDTEGVLRTFSPNGFANLDRVRADYEKRVEQDALRGRTVDVSDCQAFIHGNSALVRPVAYRSADGVHYSAYHLHRQDDGRWLIIDVNRSAPRDARCFSDELLANAGKLVGFQGMLWIRRLPVPVEKVWSAVSTKEGLDHWWLTRNVELDLRAGGLFKHHWTNTVKDVRENERIDFVGAESSSPDNLMRFELRPDGEGTVFSMFDSFADMPHPLSLPWTCSGWHGTVDALETHLTGRKIDNDFGLGGEFYFRLLRDQHRLAAFHAGMGSPRTTPEDWRAAYLVDAQ